MIAPSAAAAAEYYPAIYWYALLAVPEKHEFPGTGTTGNGLAEHLKSQAQWIDTVKTNGCLSCHAMGTPGTEFTIDIRGRQAKARVVPEPFYKREKK